MEDNNILSDKPDQQIQDSPPQMSSQTPQEMPVTPKKNSLKTIVPIVVVLILVGIGIFAAIQLLGTNNEQNDNVNTQTEEPIVIGLSLATLRTERWQRDRDFIIEEAKKYNAVVNVQNANDDTALQKSQIENLVLQGVDVLIIVPIDAEMTVEMVKIASDNNIKVIAYDRLIPSADLDYYVSFDSIKVGEIQAQGVLDIVDEGKFVYIGGSETDNNAHLVKEGALNILQPYIDEKKIEIVLDTFTPDWKQEEAYKTMKAYLEKGTTVDAIIAANDGTASGSILALREKDLDGTIPVSGQDAELSACQRIVEGTQTVTVYKPLDRLAQRAVLIAISVARGEEVEINTQVNNGKIDVPSFLLDPVMVTKDNMVEAIVKTGFHSFEDIYKNIPEELRPEYTSAS